MPRSFLVKKKRGACGAWQWKEPEQLQWKEDNIIGKKFNIGKYKNSKNVFIRLHDQCNNCVILHANQTSMYFCIYLIWTDKYIAQTKYFALAF